MFVSAKAFDENVFIPNVVFALFDLTQFHLHLAHSCYVWRYFAARRPKEHTHIHICAIRRACLLRDRSFRVRFGRVASAMRVRSPCGVGAVFPRVDNADIVLVMTHSRTGRT